MSVIKLFWITVLTLVVAVTAQAQSATGTILGTVTDESGAIIPSASVKITNKATGISRVLTTNAEGLYSSPALPAGDYEVRTELQGFTTLVRNAQVQAGTDTTVNMAMKLGGTKEVVTVESASAQINYDTHTVEGSIQRQSIQELPLNGRNFLQLASLEPGVTIAAQATSVRNSPIAINILGDSGVSVPLVTLDGFEINDRWAGTGTQLNFSQEMVQEFQLSSVNYDLSTPTTGVGAVNIVTRSGGNDFHGSAYFFYRDYRMAAYPGLARNPLNPNPYFARRDPGFWLSGPIIKNKLFFFFDWERTSQVQAVTVQPGLASFTPVSGIFPSPQTYKSINARFDYHLSSKNTVFVRYTHDGNNSFGQNAGAPPSPSNWVSLINWSDQMAIGLTTIVSPNVVNDLRFAYNYWNTANSDALASQCQFPCVGAGLPQALVYGTGFYVGNNQNSPLNKLIRDYNAAEALSWQKGKHRFRFGGSIEFWSVLQNDDICDPACLDVVPPEFATSLAGSAANVAQYFPGLLTAQIKSTADILNLPVYNIPQALYGGIGVGTPIFPGPYNFGQVRRNRMPSFYAQDVWKVRPRLTVNYGLSYAYQSGLFNSNLPKPAFLTPIIGNTLSPTPSDKLDFAPSVGFAWNIDKSGKTVIRGGAGMYWDMVPFYWKSKEDAEAGPAGNGRLTTTAGVFTNTLPNIYEFVGGKATLLPIGATLPVQTLTTMTLGQFLQIYNQQFTALSQKITPTPPTSGSFSVTDLDIIKNASEINPQKFPLMRSYQTSIGVQRDLGHEMVITADWARRQFVNSTLGEVDLNQYNSVQGPKIPKCTTAQLFVVGQECSTGSITFWQPEGRVIYEGLLVKLNKRFSKHYQFVASYAFQNLNSESVVNLNNYFQGYGPHLARQNLNVAGLIDLPWGFSLSLNSSIISRTPLTPVIPGVDLSGTGAVSAGPLPGLSYNCINAGCGKSDLNNAVAAWNANYAGTKGPTGATLPKITLPSDYEFGDPTFVQDFRLTKIVNYKERYHASFFLEVFNAFNIANLTGYTYSLNSASFGQPTQRSSQSFLSGGPRALQIGGRFVF